MQPLVAHEHWHVDMSYINVAGTFYYLTSILDGYSRAIVHAEVRESMTERDVETVVQRAREKYPRAPAPQRVGIHESSATTARSSLPASSRSSSHRRHDARTHQPLLSTVEREVGALAHISSNASAFDRQHAGNRPTKLAAAWPPMSSTTTTCVYVAPSATLRRSTSWPDGSTPSGKPAMPGLPPREKEGPLLARRAKHCLTARSRHTMDMTWAEDRATQECDPSARPGPEPKGGRWFTLPPNASLAFGIGGTRAKLSRHDAATAPAGMPLLLAAPISQIPDHAEPGHRYWKWK